jgi:hypothetical protein
VQLVLHCRDAESQAYAPQSWTLATQLPPWQELVWDVVASRQLGGRHWCPQVPQLLPSLPFTVTQVVPPQQS